MWMGAGSLGDGSFVATTPLLLAAVPGERAHVEPVIDTSTIATVSL